MVQTITDNNKLSRSAQIEEIIIKRQPLVNKIRAVQENLNFISNSVSEIEDKRNRFIEEIDDESIIDKLKDIGCKSINEKIKFELNALDKLKSRFSRGTLNIGVVGRARQGKSRLLQSLTGLSKAEIPDGDDQHCTGVRSNIHQR